MVKLLLRPMPFRFQQVVLEAYSPSDLRAGFDVRPLGLYPVKALKIYVNRMAQWHRCDQRFVCFGKNKGAVVTKQRMSHWVIKAISAAYGAHGMASSQALFKGSSLEDICVAAGWSTPNTFIKFYGLDMRTAPRSYLLEQTFSLVSCYLQVCEGIMVYRSHSNRYAACEPMTGNVLVTYNPKSEKVGTVWKTQIKKESSDF